MATAGLIAATAPPQHIAPLVDLDKMRRDGFLILPVRSAPAGLSVLYRCLRGSVRDRARTDPRALSLPSALSLPAR
eukprot:SAG31_NODE_3138_length_4632_cov_2.290315_1_plen_76_part_00